MQDKGDMMSSLAFLYNYVLFFADPTYNKTINDKDPFFSDFLATSGNDIPDPLKESMYIENDIHG